MNILLQRGLAFCLLFGLAACDSGGPAASFNGDEPDDVPFQPPSGAVCELPSGQVVSGGPGKDGIPALTDPPTVSAGEVDYLQDDDRVIGLLLKGTPTAIPHNVLWWHEIVNYNTPSEQVAVTYCPLTGSSIVFDRAPIGGAELGVSGLLYNNNLIMYDRNAEEALWSQMLTGAGCESSKNISLTSMPHIEMTWGGWKALYPDTKVLSASTGFTRNYTRYPYGNYENEDNADLLFRQPALDERRPPKERVLGVPGRDGRGLAFPFGKLDLLGEKTAVNTNFDGRELLVLWDRRKEAAVAFSPQTTEGQVVRIDVVDGRFVDSDTGSIWQVDGVADSGPLAGRQLLQIPDAYVAFWFAWATFHPEIEIF